MMIQIEGLHYSYPDSSQALDGISMKVKKGEFAALIGKNGSGKSTLIQHLNGILLAQKGHVIIDGTEINRETARDIRMRVGIVFQNPDDMLFSPTVYEDVAFGPRNMGLRNGRVHDLVHKALESVGAAELEDKNPHHLSLGQKKRVSLAAVISMSPDVIAFDEPTSHLDPKGRKEIMELILRLKCTKIIATHDLSVLGNCDTIHVMDKGKIQYSGKMPGNSILKKFGLA